MSFANHQSFLLYACLAGLLLTSAPLVLVSVWPFVRAAWDSLGSRSARVIFLIAAGGACLFGGAKHIVGTITYPRTDPEVWYLQDNGSAVSNAFLRINFNRNIIVPVTASFYIDGLALQYTNQADWATHAFNAYSNTFANASVPFDLPFADATNYNWIVYTDWTPPPVVHTNGVSFVGWQIGVGKLTNCLAMTRTGVYANGVKTAPNPSITNGPPLTLTITINQGEQEDE